MKALAVCMLTVLITGTSYSRVNSYSRVPARLLVHVPLLSSLAASGILPRCSLFLRTALSSPERTEHELFVALRSTPQEP